MTTQFVFLQLHILLQLLVFLIQLKPVRLYLSIVHEVLVVLVLVSINQHSWVVPFVVF